MFLAGNGISFYGDHGSELVDESSESRGDNLLTRVCRSWQEAAQPAVDAGARVVVLRTTPVLDRRSAPLNVLARLFRFGLGGQLGSGEQYFPCVTAEDWVRAVIFCADHAGLGGPFNLTLPQPATNDEFTHELGSLVHRPTVFTVPSFVLRPAAGPMAPELLGSLRVVPKALLDAGFEFHHPDIHSALEAGLSAGR